ncbi:hypothetical protein ABW20_dc0105360 [Dactylellina cionopaga]|nr:hypothetical protein ABW20_dc0105360 [Dactylellina cionopaga]
MEFFVPDVPLAATRKQINAAFSDLFRKYFIYKFELHHWKPKNKHVQWARIIIHDVAIAEEILQKSGKPPPRTVRRGTQTIIINGKPRNPILIAGSQITLLRSNKSEPIPNHMIQALRDENDRKAKTLANRQPAEYKPYRNHIPFTGVECGVWTTDPRNPILPTFNSFFSSIRTGNFRLTRASIQIEVFESPTGISNYMLFDNRTIRSAVITREGGDTYFSVSLRWSPKFYHKTMGDIDYRTCKLKVVKYRVSALEPLHEEIAPFCFVYRFKLRDSHDTIRLIAISAIPGFPEVTEGQTFYQVPPYTFQRSMATLQEQLRGLPFDVAYQLQAIVVKGLLLPPNVKELLGVVRQAVNTYGDEETAAVIKFWREKMEPQLNSDDPIQWLSANILSGFIKALENRKLSKDVILQMKLYRKENHALIHRVYITPAGMWLDGPALEPMNRVLREHKTHLNHFIRVSFVEEGRGQLCFERGVDSKLIYGERFLPFMLPGSDLLKIAGRTFSFLGFSQSSLRSQTVWFMAPFNTSNGYKDVDTMIRFLGDFSNIRIPGKCAARIGQAFTDTTANIKIQAGMLVRVPDIERQTGNRKYTFSDGCGTISRELLKMIHQRGGFNTKEVKPTIFQIRYGGAKGVVSLDTRLHERQLRLRDSMVKYEARNHITFEICKSIDKPVPLHLNRHLIKILEDRGVPRSAFMQLQNEALREFHHMSLVPDRAAYFLQNQNRCISADTPFLIRELFELGWNYQEDQFLRQVVEFSMLHTLREMKYRARIPVAQGFTLIGILDETGYLEEGEIYCPIKKEDQERWAPMGKVAISRSPAYFPGDIQIVTAIEVPYNSPLRELTNCVVFPQRGPRDLPNMMSGGDLDGDEYHVWWDPRLMPTIAATPADFESVKAPELDREVTQTDIARFFLDVMENDRVGQIATAHWIFADQNANGVYSEECLKCAQLASVAVDFPKTGVPVRIGEIPRTPTTRPDFLAPSPSVRFVSGKLRLHSTTEDADSDDEDEGSDSNILTSSVDADDPFAAEKRYLYYESPKALGHLFRAIDEFQFVKMWESTASRRYETQGPTHLLRLVLDHLLRNGDLHKIAEFNEFARHLRVSYETNIRDMSHEHMIRRGEPLQEVEVFIGSIIGTESHRQSRLQRETSEKLRGEVNRLIPQTVKQIRHGSEQNVIEEGKYDGFTLERAIACVMESLTAREDGVDGRSFGWLAAAVGLKELNKKGVQKNLENNTLLELMRNLRMRS